MRIPSDRCGPAPVPRIPAYSDVLYVEGLIAPDVINTMPATTLRAFADHGEASRALSESTSAAEEILRDAEAAGIDLAAITGQLEREGVDSFCASYRDLLAGIERKLSAAAPAPSP